jgi:FtsZ-interacting cell division protein YlmF
MIKASYFPVKYVLMAPQKREDNARIAPVQPRRYSNARKI